MSNPHHTTLGPDGDGDVTALVLRWQELERQGSPPGVESLCAGRPDLAPEVRRRVEALKAIGSGDTLAHAPPQDGLSPLPAVPGYEVLEELGRGGMGVVYKARQVGLGRLVALKMILAGPHAGREELARFRTEAEAIARLAHPGIVQVFEVGERHGAAFIALEFCSGGGLNRKLAGRPMPPEEAARLVRSLAEAMQAAHAAAVIHRDLKPANVLLTEDGAPKVTDFGLARKLDEKGHTQTGSILGTPSYMAPEQARGDRAGPAADVYSLGAILYECLTGKPPFEGATFLETLTRVATQEPVAPSRLEAKVPRDLETVCLKCLSKEPARRYASAKELADDLGRFLAGEPIAARPVGATERVAKWARRNPAVAALLVLVAAALAGGATASTLFALDAREQAREARQQSRTAEENAERARRNQEAAEHERRESRRAVYAAHLNLAAQAWQDGDLGRARQLLALHLPEQGEEELRGWEWYRLWQNTHAEWLTLKGHDRWVRTAAWSPDGDRLVTGSYDNTVRVWDAKTGRALGMRKNHTDAVHRVAFHRSGRLIASGSDDGTVQLWDLEAGRDAALAERFGQVWALAFSPDGKSLATADVDGKARLYPLGPGGEPGVPVEVPDVGRCACLAFSPDGGRIAFGCRDGLVVLYDVKAGRSTRHTFAELGGGVHVRSIAFSPDGRRLALGGVGGMVRLWDLTGRTLEPAAASPHKESVWGLGFSPDGETLVSSSWDRKIALWPLRSGWEPTVLLGHVEAVKFAGFHPHDPRLLATASRDGTVRLWRLPVRQGERSVAVAGALELVAPPAGEAVLVRGEEVRCYGVHGEAQKLPDGLGRLLGSAPAALSADGKLVAAASGGGVRLFDRAGGEEVAARADCHGKDVDLVALSADGRLVLTGCTAETSVRVWRVTGKSLEREPEQLAVQATAAAFSPDCRRVALLRPAAGEGAVTTASVWDREKGLSRPLPEMEGSADAIAFSPDGLTLAVGGARQQGDHSTGVARLHDAATGEPAGRTAYAQAAVRSLAFAPDGRTLAGGDEAGEVKLWAPATGEEKGTLRLGEGWVERLCFGRDGRSLVAFVKGERERRLVFVPSCDDEEVRAHLRRNCEANPGDAELAAQLRRMTR